MHDMPIEPQVTLSQRPAVPMKFLHAFKDFIPANFNTTMGQVEKLAMGLDFYFAASGFEKEIGAARPSEINFVHVCLFGFAIAGNAIRAEYTLC